jgi:hypothetical protein
MRKHLKRKVQSGGASPDGNIPLPLMTKGESFYQMQRTEAWFQGEQIYQMQRTEAWFQGEHE